MDVTPLALPGVLLIEPRVFSDDRGHFLELFQALRYGGHGAPAAFVQDNLSFSRRGVVRGLHYQLRQPQGKLLTVLAGEIVDVIVDIRVGSPTFSRWLALPLAAANYQQVYVPPGYAHGFCVTSETATVHYKCTDLYNPGDEYGLIWNDPRLNIPWPFTTAILSPKDAQFLPLDQIPPEQLPVYTPTP